MAHPPALAPTTCTEQCAKPDARRDAGVLVRYATAGGPRLAVRIARVWCALVPDYAAGTVEITGEALGFTSVPPIAAMGVELVLAVGAEREDDASEPFVCVGGDPRAHRPGNLNTLERELGLAPDAGRCHCVPDVVRRRHVHSLIC